MSGGALSSRSPTKLAWRSIPARVMFVYLTSASSFGSTHRQPSDRELRLDELCRRSASALAALSQMQRYVICHRSHCGHGGLQLTGAYAELLRPVAALMLLAHIDALAVGGGLLWVVGYVASRAFPSNAHRMAPVPAV
jgi:hypothetical protein